MPKKAIMSGITLVRILSKSVIFHSFLLICSLRYKKLIQSWESWGEKANQNVKSFIKLKVLKQLHKYFVKQIFLCTFISVYYHYSYLALFSATKSDWLPTNRPALPTLILLICWILVFWLFLSARFSILDSCFQAWI